MKMLSVVYVLMVNATATMLFSFVISVTWQFTRSAMGFRTYRMVRGFAEDVCTHRHVRSRAAFVRVGVEPSNRLTTVIGHMLSVHCGYQKLDLQTVCFWNPLTVLIELQLHVGSLHAAFVSVVALVHVSSVTRQVATQHSMSHVPNRLACI